MSDHELSAREIETRPAGEANFELSQRIYDSAAGNPNQFRDISKQLDSDVKSGSANGVQLEHDEKGNVTAISINNENLYSSKDSGRPTELALSAASIDPDKAPTDAAAPPAAPTDAAAPVTDATVPPGAAADATKPPVDLFKPERSDVPASDVSKPTDAAKPDDAQKSDDAVKAGRDAYEKDVNSIIDSQSKSLPVQRGEGYYQVVSRMHPQWTDEHKMAETHHVKALNHSSDELKVGQQLDMATPEEKQAASKKQLEAYDQATPEQREKLKAEAKQAITEQAKVADAPAPVAAPAGPVHHSQAHFVSHQFHHNRTKGY